MQNYSISQCELDATRQIITYEIEAQGTPLTIVEYYDIKTGKWSFASKRDTVFFSTNLKDVREDAHKRLVSAITTLEASL